MRKEQITKDMGDLLNISLSNPPSILVIYYLNCNSLLEEYQGNLTKLQQFGTNDTVLS